MGEKPDPPATIAIPVSVAKTIAAWNDNLPKHWVAGDGLTAQEADALMQVRVAYESHVDSIHNLNNPNQQQ